MGSEVLDERAVGLHLRVSNYVLAPDATIEAPQCVRTKRTIHLWSILKLETVIGLCIELDDGASRYSGTIKRTLIFKNRIFGFTSVVP
ncbi:unnamed protein product [Dibothriocephalus latus]|uniref:Uncharacterized protein n=1 Tax=Dibothriocephalus latus TaxID=60516 RepID=A0A3P6QD90_DIBLA|nr:unnamed protein product [Dibothriocephalus latus]